MSELRTKVEILIPLLAITVVLTLGACQKPPAPSLKEPADTLFNNGKIYTLDAKRSWAEAVAIKDGKIVFVGSNEAARKYAGEQTEVINLRGRMMMPAFQDSHIHPISAGIEASACDLNDIGNLGGYRAKIAEYAAANPELEWILGGGWSMSVFGPGAAPSREILDELVPDRPVYLSSADGHTGWANSLALKIAGIDSNTPDPGDGRIDRHPQTGQPIGSLQEGAMNLVTAHVPPTSTEARLQGLRYSVDLLNGFGITAVQDAAVQTDELQAYRTLIEREQLSLRVVGSLWWDRERGEEQIAELLKLRDQFSDHPLLRARTVKIMQDGVMENYTAAMLEPYLLPEETRGIPMLEPETLKRIVSLLDANGFQVHFHAIGDGAIRQSLDAVETALATNGQLGNRHHISHLQLIHPNDVPRFAELKVIANFQPLWAYPDEYVTELTIPFIGEQRSEWMYPIRAVQETGGTVAFGSDWSVSTANPFPQIETAITRKDANNGSDDALNPLQSVDLPTALEAFTINAAFVNHHEQETGTIEVGKHADLIVLDQLLFKIDPKDISDTKVLLTLFGGKPVHGRYADLQ